jgi:HK97 family phage prohead protease
MSQFVGYASVAEHPYDMGFYDEVVSRGAWSKSLAESPDVHFNLSHGAGGSGLPLARTGQNMTLAEDPHGLRVEADLDDLDPDVQLLNRKVRNGLIDAMSLAFKIVRQSWSNEHTLRRIQEASLHQGDVTVCPQGANPAAAVVSLRSAGALARLRTGGRDTARQRGQLAEQLGQTAVLEFRSVSLNGVQYDLGSESSDGSAPRPGAARASARPVIIPPFDTTPRAKLQLARARGRSGRTSTDPVSEAWLALAAARARG